MIFRQILSHFWFNVQETLFPMMEKKLGELTTEYKDLISLLELIRIEEFIPSSKFNLGRPSRDRLAIARAYVAKIFLKYNNTKRFLKRLQVDQLKVICGWDLHVRIPSESKFCRVFKEFAIFSLPEKVHQFLIQKVYKNRIIGHLVVDSTPILAREKTIEKPSIKERKKIKNDRQKAERNGVLSRRQKQLIQPLEENLKDLPYACDTGRKRSAKGSGMSWDGYKLHTAVDDNSIPIAMILTSASLNDCEAAIPLCKKASYLTTNFYDLMDSAYDMPEIKENSFKLGHVPIIEKKPKNAEEKAERKIEIERRKAVNFTPADRKRYKERFAKERSNALLKDSYGGRNFLYRGSLKISCHLMFGILSMTAMMILKLS